MGVLLLCEQCWGGEGACGCTCVWLCVHVCGTCCVCMRACGGSIVAHTCD